MTHHHILFAPLLPAWALIALSLAGGILVIYALSRRARGALLRLFAFALLILTLADPSLISEQREALHDTALLVVDDSASMQLGERPQQSTKAVEALTKKLSAVPDLDLEVLHVQGADETDLFSAIQQKLSTIPHDRLAGIIALTDGQVHDRLTAKLDAPLHILIAGHKNEADRRIIIKQAPAYGLVGKNVKAVLRVEDQGKNWGDTATVTFQDEQGQSQSLNVPVGKDVSFDLPVTHAGQNLFVFSAETMPDELTDLNNSAAVSVNGIRDRLRVLLVSGQPHIGGRTWRNFLKADPAVDLVHFTILRSPNKIDDVPNTELALIAFPVHELFAVKLNSFDLVILDQFRPQSLVPDEYLENIADYVEQGGALLVSSSTDEGLPPLALSPLARILPAEPTGKLLTGSFVPDLTPAGQRHPVTSGLTKTQPREQWGPWFRQSEARARKGDVLMSGINQAPLLVLDHVGQGRVAEFLSDQFWLWARDYGGERLRGAQSETGISGGERLREPQSETGIRHGGPQGELLRRVAHWLVQEPELDEGALHASAALTKDGWQLTVTKQSLKENTIQATVTDAKGQETPVTLTAEKQPGILGATLPHVAPGLYRVKADDRTVLVLAAPTDTPEFGDMRATADKVQSAVDASSGGLAWLDDKEGGPDIHRTRSGAAQQGWGWIGLKQNGQYRVTGSEALPLLPPALVLALLLAAFALAWRVEGKN